MGRCQAGHPDTQTHCGTPTTYYHEGHVSKVTLEGVGQELGCTVLPRLSATILGFYARILVFNELHMVRLSKI